MPSTSEDRGVEVRKFLLQMSIYPNGAWFPTITPLGVEHRRGKNKTKALEESTKSGEVEL